MTTSNPQPHGSVRIAGIVLKWIRGDKQANYDRMEPMIREAAGGGAQIIVTTECFLDGYAIADKQIPLDAYQAMGETIPEGTYFRKLADLASQLRVHLAVGLHANDGAAQFNVAVLLDPEGQIIGTYYKQRLGHEAERNQAGRESLVFPSRFGRVGMMICKDRGSAEIVRGFADRGADFLLCLSGGQFGPEKNDPVLQARSKENSLYIVFVHPAEFLVTGPDGSICQNHLLGDPRHVGQASLVTEDQVGGPLDQNRVFYFDLPML